jgi:NADP-dependent 3-hydroxy acid dehydrogenase YdfG
VDRTQTSLDATLAELGRDSDRILAFTGDVTEEATVQKYTEATMERWGHVDIVILNAGVEGAWHPLHETPMSEFDKVMSVNCRGGE